MDDVYGKSKVIAALKDTLRAMTSESLLTKELAQRVHAEALKAVRRELQRGEGQLPDLKATGEVQIYRFYKTFWTLYIKDFAVHSPNAMPSMPPDTHLMGGGHYSDGGAVRSHMVKAILKAG
ncbi:unnamed protein product [Vitrella brassicaformis CCMP3155]|uniref:Uncharacterized protein n=1 Tax=Vitrella brassicaformis (strain CCMP3155) TaxID=1169540 RepID=A0A0G4EZ41_VITBC|nr:unnamed protein product [Vitrella brassicaformis CCMP3155]|eukprot:CEM03943.1 unnamed protein product [Vitrella brassicaformis CCMP3155]